MSNKVRILLADDSRFFRSIETQFLQKTPVEIFESDSCESTLHLMRTEKPDLVYLAFSLQGGGGAECCRLIKEESDLRSIPIVMICDKGAPEQLKVARRNGCDDCLAKPLDRHTFLQTGRKFIAGIREHRQPSFFPISFTAESLEFTGKCLDISGGGMFVESKADFPSGTRLDISFQLPDEYETQVTCSATVSWLNRKPNPMKPHYPHGLGVMFIELPAAVQKSILRWAESKKSR